MAARGKACIQMGRRWVSQFPPAPGGGISGGIREGGVMMETLPANFVQYQEEHERRPRKHRAGESQIGDQKKGTHADDEAISRN